MLEERITLMGETSTGQTVVVSINGELSLSQIAEAVRGFTSAMGYDYIQEVNFITLQGSIHGSGNI